MLLTGQLRLFDYIADRCMVIYNMFICKNGICDTVEKPMVVVVL